LIFKGKIALLIKKRSAFKAIFVRFSMFYIFELINFSPKLTHFWRCKQKIIFKGNKYLCNFPKSKWRFTKKKRHIYAKSNKSEHFFLFSEPAIFLLGYLHKVTKPIVTLKERKKRFPRKRTQTKQRYFFREQKSNKNIFTSFVHEDNQ